MQMNAKKKRSMHRRYLDVQVQFQADGRIVPQVIIWDEQHKYPIDRVLYVVPRAAYGAGGQGDCYTVQITLGHTVFERRLFFERSAALNGSEVGRWFVEAGADA